MQSRERVKLALQHKEPDQVPIDLWGSASRISVQLYLDIIKYLGFEQPGELIRPGSDTPYEDYKLSDNVGSDFRHINIGKPLHYKSFKNEKGYLIDEWGIGRSLVGRYPTVVYNPLCDATIDDLNQYSWPIPEDEGRIAGIAQKAKQWYESTDKAITATSASSGQFFDLAQYLRGTEQFFVDLYEEEKFAHKLIEKITDILIRLNLYYLKPIAPYIEWVEFTSDLGTQNGPFISPVIFRKYFKEPFRKLFGEVKRAYPNVKIFLHSCGSIFELIPDLLEVGVEVLDPLQPLARGMDSRNIKKAFGNSVVFHGAIDIQRAINGTINDIENEVKERISALAEGGGYILSPTNHIQNDAPVENVLAMFKFAKKHGKYPIVI